MARKLIKGVLLDLSGVLYVGNEVLPGVVAALDRLRTFAVPFLCVTNTTRSTRTQILDKLTAMGLGVEPAQLFTAPMAAHDYVVARDLHPFLLIHPALASEFADVSSPGSPDAVLIGDAGEGFTYANMNRAFRLLMNGAPLVAMSHNRYFQEADGLSLDAGPFITALEYASGKQAVVTGKPSREFYTAAVKRLDCRAAEVVMIGDDVEADVRGAIAAGLQGVLVRTGKYRPGDEDQLPTSGGQVVADFAASVDLISKNLTDVS